MTEDRPETRRLITKGVVLLLLIGVGVYAVGVFESHPSIDVLGLAGGLHPMVWLGFLLIGGSLVIAIVRLPHLRHYHVLASLTVLTALHALPILVEGTPRFPFSYSVSGHVINILQNGGLTPGLLPYQNWPGMMILGSAIFSVPLLDPSTGMAFFYVFHAWVIFFLSYSIASALFQTVWKRWLAMWLFLLTNWVGQGYFVPPSVGLLLVASSLFVLIRLARAPVLPGHGRATAWVIANIIIFAALVTTHFLTSLFVLFVLLFILTLRAASPRRVSLPHGGAVLFGSMLVAWLMFYAGDFFIGQLPVWINQALTLGSITETSLEFAFSGGPERLILSNIKTFTLLLISVLALVGVARFFRQRSGNPAPVFVLLALVAGSFALVLTTAYGGEIVSRAYSYALLPLAMLACLGKLTPRGKTILAAVIVGSFPLYVISAYGNEAFDYVAATELPAAGFTLGRVGPGSTMLLSTPRTERLWNLYGVGAFQWIYDWQIACDSLSDASGDSVLVIHSERDIEAFNYLTAGQLGLDPSLAFCTSHVYSNGVVEIGKLSTQRPGT